METVSDVIVVGAGPCGSFAALKLAEKGVKVAVFEEHETIGIPSHCAGHLSIEGLRCLGLYPLPAGIVENIFYGVVFYSPRGEAFRVRFSNPVTCAVNRVLFDRYVAHMAEAAGAQYHNNSRVESLIVENGLVKGVAVAQNGCLRRVSAKLVIDAEGISSRLVRQAGLFRPNRWFVNGVEADVVDAGNSEPDMVEVFLGKTWAPGSFSWLIPKPDGRAKVGLASRVGHPGDLLHKLMSEHPIASLRLRNSSILQKAFHPITLGGPLPKTFADGFLVVGDAASQVKPTTGGGIVLGLTCARVASEVVYEALCRNDLTSRVLSSYRTRCQTILGFDTRIMLGIRRTLDSMSDRQVDDLIRFCVRFGLGKALEKAEDIDFQGRSLLRILPNPRTLATLFCISNLYVSANAQNLLRKKQV